jgi:hypothetical protein
MSAQHHRPRIRAGWEDEQIAPPIPWAWYGLVAVCTVLVSALLSGCGGGSDEDDQRATTQPVDCFVTPERCK